MFTESDLSTLDWENWLRANRRRFLWKENEELQLAENLVETAKILTGKAGEIERHGSWWIIGCREDWLGGNDRLTVFSKLTPFPAAGPNEIRPEALLTAFAKKVVTLSNNSHHWIVGAVSTEIGNLTKLLKRKHWRRIVAFCVRD